MGVLAVLAALGSGGQTTDTKGALRTLLDQPFGAALLFAVALGLVGFAVWRTAQALADADGHGSEPKGLTIRFALLVSAVLHGSLALFAVSLVFGWGGAGDSGDRSAQDWTARLLAQPYGRWLVAGVGLAVICAGIVLAARGWRCSFMHRLTGVGEKDSWIKPLGRAGYLARGVVFWIVGGFLMVAAWHASSGSAKGLGGALRTLQDQPYGWVLLALVAGGLAAFGAFGLVQAAYRQVDVPREPRIAV